VSQTRLESLVEALSGQLVGIARSVLLQRLIFPLFGIELALSENIEITLWFALASLAERFLLRRLFAWRERRAKLG